MKTHELPLLLLFLAAVAAGCGSQGESPSRAENNGTVISNDTPASVVEPDRPAEVPVIETGTGTLEPDVERTVEPVYAVAEYDANRDPQADLDAAVQEASRDGKRILLEIGGNW